MTAKQYQQADFPQEEQEDVLMRALGATQAAGQTQLVILDESKVVLPMSKLQLRLFKVFDPNSGESRRLAVDKNDKRVDYEKALVHLG